MEINTLSSPLQCPECFTLYFRECLLPCPFLCSAEAHLGLTRAVHDVQGVAAFERPEVAFLTGEAQSNELACIFVTIVSCRTLEC